MKVRTTLLILMMCVIASAICFADDLNIGTWKLNELKSRIGTGMPKNNAVVYEAAGDNVKVTIDGVAGDGKPIHSEWTGTYDGKDYPVTGDPSVDSRSYKKINDHTYEITTKLNGKTNGVGKLVISTDGKSRTLFLKATSPDGKTMKSIAVYDKQ